MRNKNLLSIGQALKEVRESQKIPLKKIADQTRINISLLKAIEEGQVSAFPVHAYLRGFILAYVKALDLNEKEWEEELKSFSPTEENVHLSEVAGAGGPAEVLIEKDMRLTPVILATLILFILGSILVLSNVLSSHQEKAQDLSQNQHLLELETGGKPNIPPPLPEEERKKIPSSEENSAKNPLRPDSKKPLEEQPTGDSKNPLRLDSKKPLEEQPTGDSKSHLKPDNKKFLEEKPSGSKNPSVLSKDSPAPPKQAPTASPSSLNKKELEIIVKALEEVRVHYQVDQGEKKSILLAEDQFKVIKGKKSIFIKTRHSDLVYIFYNGKDLGLFGSGGKKEQSFSLTKTP